MCGIFGAVRFSYPFSELEKYQLETSVDMTHYRGPDATGKQYFSSLEGKQPNIFFGHNRLAIIDLSSDGIQPFTNDNKIHIVFNGEIYNYIELRSELLAEGYQFHTKTDTEVIINLYKSKGIDGFSKMNGMWSFIIFDSEKKEIILSRDRFAVKPLYYTFENDTYYFGSEIKQLLPFVKTPSINKDTFGNYIFSYLVEHDNDTFFRNIYKLPQKHTMIIDLQSGEKHIKPYWNYQEQDFSQRKQDDLQEEFLYLLYDSIRLRLRSDVKVGNTLSGGLDSSSIAVIANEINASPLNNISVISKKSKYSEESFVNEIIKKGITVQKIYSDDINYWEDVEKVSWHNDEPLLSVSTIAHYNMMKKFREQTDITVILSGQGGDENLGGYNKYFYENVKQLYKGRAYSNFAKESLYLIPKFFGEFKITNARRYLNKDWQKGSVANKVINLSYKNSFLSDAVDFRERQILDIDKFSVPALTHYEDRMSMSQALEIRLPFLDFRLVNFNLNLPIEYKIRNGYTKYILRNSLKTLPPKIAWRNDKKGFNVDENLFVNRLTEGNIKSMFKNSVLADSGILDTKAYLRIIHDYVNGEKKYWIRDINRIIFAEIWAKQFIK